MVHVLTLILAGAQIVLRSVLIKTFWAWFIMTQFTGLPSISYVGAIGLSLFVGAMTPHKSITKRDWEDSKEDHSEMQLLNAVFYVVGCLICLGIGWVVHSLM